MNKTSLLFCFVTASLAVISCRNSANDSLRSKAKSEIEAAEKDFEKMAGEKGIEEAFWFYADSNAVIKRENDSLITGKDNIKNYYSAGYFKTASVNWSADFVDASPDGKMGYTYGTYLWRSKDSTGKVNESKGIFHTVWKKQPGGEWKYVWD